MNQGAKGMSWVRASVLAALTAILSTMISTSAASADEGWVYWGDGVPSTTGERVVTFDNGGITPTTCTLTLRVRRYVDLPNQPGWLEPTTEVACDANPGKVWEIAVYMFHNQFEQMGQRTVGSTNGVVLKTKYDGPRGHHCFTAQGVKDGSYTGSNSVTICGTWF